MTTSRPSIAPLVALSGALLIAACSNEPGADAPDAGPSPDAAISPDAAVSPDAAITDPFESGCSDQTSSTPGLVTTAVGDIQGAQEDNGVWRFLGIPFAEPPVGELRWRPPVQPGCLDPRPFVADSFGPKCPQLEDGDVVGAEDCLHLNVWTPRGYGPDSKLPVMVYIHGGANILGSTSDMIGPGRPAYTGRLFAERHDVVFVTAQYRLGPLGFLALPELSTESEHGASGHYAHLDQIAALEWVQAHIARFGGDPERVMVFGQSAGAVNVCALLASPRAEGLFSSALMQSGFCTARTLEAAEAQHDLGVGLFDDCRDASDRLACLRALPADRVVSTIPGSIEVGAGGSAEGGAGMVYGPVVEGHLLPDAPLALIARGAHNDVPVVLGTTADEMASGTIFSAEVDTVEDYEAFIAAAFAEAGDAAVSSILQLYPASDYASPQDALVQVYTDRAFTSNARRLARAAAAGARSPTYRYLFSKRTQTPAGTLPARHGIDVVYVFGTIATVPLLDPTPEDLAIADAMMSAWAALARSGDPNAAPLGTTWPAYDAARDDYLEFGATVSTGEGLRTEKCDMWDALLSP